MVAINFSVFLDKVEDRTKTQTIRKTDSGLKHGDAIQLYTGMRTKACRKLVDIDPVCRFVDPITIHKDKVEVLRIHQLGLAMQGKSSLTGFAQEDGFDNWESMTAFFDEKYELPFNGYLIAWHWPDTGIDVEVKT